MGRGRKKRTHREFFLFLLTQQKNSSTPRRIGADKDLKTIGYGPSADCGHLTFKRQTVFLLGQNTYHRWESSKQEGKTSKNVLIGGQNRNANLEGGKTRSIDYSDRPQKLEQIKQDLKVLREAINQRGWGEIRKTYSDSVKNACRSVGDIYGGPHNFRANYVQDRVKELTQRGILPSPNYFW